MSQAMRIVKVNGTFYPKILIWFPDYTEALNIVGDMLEDGIIDYSSDYNVVTHWYEIGEGENAIDYFYHESQLIEWYELGGIEEIEKNVNKDGHKLVHIMNNYINIDGSELDYNGEDEW